MQSLIKKPEFIIFLI